MNDPTGSWTFDVTGLPKAQPRAKATTWGGGRARMYTPPTAEQWKHAVAEAALEAIPADRMPIGVGVGLSLVFYLPRPKRLLTKANAGRCSVPHLARPDLDNLEKAVKDALKDGGVVVDDCQVFKVNKIKVYADAGEMPGLRVELSEYGDD